MPIGGGIEQHTSKCSTTSSPQTYDEKECYEIGDGAAAADTTVKSIFSGNARRVPDKNNSNPEEEGGVIEKGIERIATASLPRDDLKASLRYPGIEMMILFHSFS